MSFAIVILLVLAILLVVFTLQNSVEVSINFFIWTLDNVPLVLLLIASVVIGYIIASIYFYPRLWQRKKEFKKLQKEYKKLEEAHKEFEPAIKTPDEIEEKNPEGVEMDDDNTSSFFKED